MSRGAGAARHEGKSPGPRRTNPIPADPDGRARVNIEVVSEHYSGASIAAKAAAGFSIHSSGSGGSASGGRPAAKIAAAFLGSAAGSGSRSGGGRGGGRAKGTIEL